MPNWTQNFLRVEGTEAQVKGFDNKFKGKYAIYKDDEDPQDPPPIGKHRCLNALFPVPKKVTGGKYYSRELGIDGYTWQTSNWGTKWDIDVKEANVEGGQADYYFESAWNPPHRWLRKVASDFPHLKFNLFYINEGGEGAGVYEFRRGVFRRKEFTNDLAEMREMGAKERCLDWKWFPDYEEEDEVE